MAITSYGYRGTIDEVQWARMAPHISAARYGVVGEDDCVVTAVPGLDRVLRVGPGRAWGQGVMDELNHDPEPLQVQLPPVASGSRWDLIALRRSWLETPGKTTVMSIQGTSSKVIPAARESTAGGTDDQPLALVRVVAGQSLPAEIIDLRCWASNGGVQVLNEIALQYLAFPGSMVWHKWRTWAYTRDDRPGSTWNWFKIGDIGILHGLRNDSFSGWEFDGVVSSTQDPPHRITTLTARIKRTGASIAIGSADWMSLGVILPDSALSKQTPRWGTNWVHVPGTVTDGGSNGIVKVAINTLDGAIRVASYGSSVTIRENTHLYVSATWNALT
jgi:hypothetical protein